MKRKKLVLILAGVLCLLLFAAIYRTVAHQRRVIAPDTIKENCYHTGLYTPVSEKMSLADDPNDPFDQSINPDLICD